MPELDQKGCQEFYEETCRQKAQEIIASVSELIDQAVDGNSAMAGNIKLKVAADLLEDSQYKIVPDDKSVIFEMAPAVLSNGTKIDLWQTVADDRKMIDVRARTKKYDSLDVDDIVCFQRSDGAQILRRIGLVFKADSLSGLLESIIASDLFSGSRSIRLHKIISVIVPGIATIKALTQVVNAWPGNAEKIEKYGVVAFVLMPLTSKELLEHKLKQLGWNKKTTNTGAEIFARAVDEYTEMWKEKVRQRHIQENKQNIPEKKPLSAVEVEDRLVRQGWRRETRDGKEILVRSVGAV